MFTDRKEAGKQLAEKLEEYRGKDAVVLALPRGGVVLGCEVARALAVPLDIVVVRKIGSPLDPEYAIGAVDALGTTVLNEDEVALVSASWLQEEITKESAEAQRRSTVYREGRPPVRVEGKSVIIVDDGVATGFTARLAVRSVRAQHPKQVIVAVPIASVDALQALKKEGADKIITLLPAEDFTGAIGAHYERFEQVEDAEVIKLLQSLHA